MGEAADRTPDGTPVPAHTKGLTTHKGNTILARHVSPHNQTSVPVLDQNGNPLAPTRPSRARRLMEQGRAVKTWKHGRFAIRMTDRSQANCVVPTVTLGIDPGAPTTGLAVTITTTAGEKVIAGCEVKHRGHRITQAMLSRRAYRRLRRQRIRRRPARFNNRRRPKGWLPPSLLSIAANIRTNVRHLTELFPIAQIAVETCRFDPRLISDPDVFGKGYQHSERDHMQVREYVLQRDGRTCQYCGETKGQMEIDHVIPKSRGGSDRISNLATACHPCNQVKGNRPLEEFLAGKPERLARIRRRLQASLQSAAHLNALMPRIVADLRELGIATKETDAVNTAYNRRQLGVDKTHVNDAACLTGPEALLNVPERVTEVTAVGHGKRQMLTQISRHGTPRFKTGVKGKYQGYRAWCRLPRAVQGFTPMPGHKLRQRRVSGICSGDLIAYEDPAGESSQGYAVLTNNKTRGRVSGQKSVSLKNVKLLARSNGYRYTLA